MPDTAPQERTDYRASDWGVVFGDSGIEIVAPTRQRALLAAGICTPIIRRERLGALYCYSTRGGSELIVGRVRDLRSQQFPWSDDGVEYVY